MNFDIFKNYILKTPVLTEEYKENLLKNIKKDDNLLFNKIISIVYSSEKEVIEIWKKMKKERIEKEKLQKKIEFQNKVKEDEKKEIQEAENKIDNLLQF